MESISLNLKGRVSIVELMDRPFRELHEYYKLAYDRAEARAKAEKERVEREAKQREEEENAERRKKGLPPLIKRAAPPDAKEIIQTNSETQPMSSLDADMYEEAMEELVEGGAISE